MTEIRLQKILADAGIASRRAAELLILEGRVTVDGMVASLGDKARLDQQVELDGQAVRVPQKKVIYAFYKPRGVVSTNSDPHHGKTITDFFPDGVRVYPVGRLDKDSEGLMLVTNDGALAYELTHPKHEHEKEYEVVLSGEGKPLADFEKSHRVSGQRVQPMQLRGKVKMSTSKWLVRLVLREGKKRQIREVAQQLGYKVMMLKRIRIAKLKLAGLAPGKWRRVERSDIV